MIFDIQITPSKDDSALLGPRSMTSILSDQVVFPNLFSCYIGYITKPGTLNHEQQTKIYLKNKYLVFRIGHHIN